MSNMKVPITDPLWQVRLAQAGLAPSEATMRMARLLLDMEALHRAEAISKEKERTREEA
jgi:hypothetical protein